MAAEFLYRLGRLNMKYQYKCHSVAEMMLQLGESLQSAIKDEEMLNYYLREQTDFNNRSALEIIAENRFYDLLKDENVAAIVSKLWYGTGKNLTLFTFCRMTRILSSSFKHEQYDDVINRTYNEMKTKNYSFQYQQYINNCSVRYLVDSISTIFTTALYQVIIYYFVNLSKDGKPFENEKFKFGNSIANFIVYTINLNAVLYYIYVYKTNRNMKFTIWIVIETIMFIAVLCNTLRVPEQLILGSAIAADAHVSNVNLTDAILYSVIIVCAWLRVMSILFTTRTFGPFLRMIYLLVWTIFNFLLIFFAINTVFAQIFVSIFKGTNDDFVDFFTSWLTLFNSAFGVYDFGNFNQMQIFGYVLLILYITISNVMLLNLVIAIINNLYNFFKDMADAENRSVLVLNYERLKWDSSYGLLILLPAPFNILSLFFIIILLLAPEHKREQLNTVFSKIAYVIVAFANFAILVIISLTLLPFSYIKSLMHSSYDNFSTLTCSKLHKALIPVFTRPIKLFWYILQDTFYYWQICYKVAEDEEKIKDMGTINRDVILAFRKVLFDYRYKNKKKIISLEDLYSRLKLNKKAKLKDTVSQKGLILHQLQLAPIINNGGLMSKSSSDIGEDSNINVTHKQSEYPGTNYNIGPSVINDNHTAFKYLIDKFVDKDRLVDIDRALVLLPARVFYHRKFYTNLYYMNMRSILRGLRNFFFINAVNNPVYSYKKLQQMIYKILIKLRMIFNYLPEGTLEKVRSNLDDVNKEEKFMKTLENLRVMEEADELSDYDDQGEFTNVNANKNEMMKKYQITDENLMSKTNSGRNSSISDR